MICQIQAATLTTQYQYDGTTAKLRIYYSKSYIGSSQEQVVGAAVGSEGWFDEVDCTVSGGRLTHPAFNLVATVDGTPPTARVFVVLYSEDGVSRETLYGDSRGWFVPAVVSITPAAWQIANRAAAIFEPLREYLTAPDTTALILSLLAATAPSLHAATHESGGSDEIDVTGLLGLLGSAQTPLAHKASHQLAGADQLDLTGLSGLLATAQVPVAHKTSHQLGGSDAIKLDDLAAPDDNTDLNASITAHGLVPKLSNVVTQFLNGQGGWTTPAGSGDVVGPASATDNAVARYDGTTGMLVQNSNLTLPDDAASTEVGYMNIPQNSQSVDYTAVMADRAQHIFHPPTDNNPRTFTIPANAGVAYPIGTAITFVNKINTVTIAITSDTLTWAQDGTTGSRSLAANGICTALKISATEWLISGTGLS